jgi:hypothetical protein
MYRNPDPLIDYDPYAEELDSTLEANVETASEFSEEEFLDATAGASFY